MNISFLRRAGDFLQFALPAAGAYASYKREQWKGLKKWLKGTVITAAVTQGLKFAFNYTVLGRRPDGGSRSFPSGHTSSAFSGASLFSSAIEEELALSMLVYFLACTVGCSRIAAKRHHPRDVALGAAIGICGTYYSPFYQTIRDKGGKLIGSCSQLIDSYKQYCHRTTKEPIQVQAVLETREKLKQKLA